MDQDDDDVWDSEDAKSWFIHEVKADAPGGLDLYAAQPPRGMSNPPMNSKVRKQLLQDVLDYGTPVTVSAWPPPVRKAGGSRSAVSSPDTSTHFQSTSSSTGSSPPSRTALSRVALSQSYVANMRRGVIAASASAPGNLGAAAGPSTSQPQKGLVAPMWHTYAFSSQKLQPLDRKKGQQRTERTVHFIEDNAFDLDSDDNPRHDSRGNNGAAEYIKTPSNATALAMARRQSLEGAASGSSGGSRRLSVDAPGVTRKKKDATQDKSTEVSQDGSKKGPPMELEEREIEEKMRGLRGASQLHRAAATDRFRFGADSSAGMPTVLRCTSAPNANPGVWASDAAFLNKFHNSAIRVVDPSGLQVLKQPKKRKKKKKDDDEDDLKMSDSGLFVARYPIDGALKSLRRLRKKMFPEYVVEVPKETEEEKARKAAALLKADIGGFMLAGVKKRHADQDAAAANALAASGYGDNEPSASTSTNHPLAGTRFDKNSK